MGGGHVEEIGDAIQRAEFRNPRVRMPPVGAFETGVAPESTHQTVSRDFLFGRRWSTPPAFMSELAAGWQ